MIDFNKRLSSLKNRRQGTRERVAFENLHEGLAKSAIATGLDIRTEEDFEKLKEPTGVKYAVGAMAAVDSQSTSISIREGDRVADSLIKSLKIKGENVVKRIQGSVALDIHIEGHSDVDMLIIVSGTVYVEHPKVEPSGYVPATDPRKLLDIIRDVRLKSETILSSNFPKADVDVSGNKAIAIEGGSLARKVDIVPAAWYDTIFYQKTDEEHHRGVSIYHKADHDTLMNYPFKHIKVVNDKDAYYSGNLKCVIRLMKNIIADMPDYKRRVAKKLTSYDLAVIGYHMEDDLNLPEYMRLGLVERTREHLNRLLLSKEFRESLMVPDGTRKIFDDGQKVEALEVLYKECDDLAFAIFKELKPLASKYDPSSITGKVLR